VGSTSYLIIIGKENKCWKFAYLVKNNKRSFKHWKFHTYYDVHLKGYKFSFVLYVCVRFLNYYFNLSIFCNFLLGCVYTKRICKSYVLFCVWVFFFGSEGFFIHLELLLRVVIAGERRKGLKKEQTDSLFLSSCHTKKREQQATRSHTHTMRNWVSTYLLNLKKNVGHCCNNQLHHSHIWRTLPFHVLCSNRSLYSSKSTQN
jgi:hypothetical protein